MGTNRKAVSAAQWNTLINRVLDAEKWKECTDPWNPDQMEEARTLLHDAYQALKEAMRSAPWGANGSAFVTRQSPYIGAPHPEKDIEVWICRRLRARFNSPRVEVFSAEQAEESYLQTKEGSRRFAVNYEVNLKFAAQLLFENGITEIISEDDGACIGPMAFVAGQCGGYLTWVVEDPRSPQYRQRVSVSAPGALRRAVAIADEESECDPFHGSPEELSIERRYYGARH